MGVNRHMDYIKSKDGTKLCFEKSVVQNSRATIIIIHGVCEHQGRYDHVVDKFNEYNFNVYRFDYRGHGKSEGKKAHVEDFGDLIDDTDAIVNLVRQEEVDSKVFILGHSFGGLIGLIYGIKFQRKVNGFIISAPTASDEAGILAIFKNKNGKDEYVPNNLANLVCSDKNIVRAYEDDPLVHKELTVGIVQEMINGNKFVKKNISKFLDPVFFIHGENDQIISYLDSEILFKLVPSKDKKIKIYSGMYHEVLNEKIKDKVLEELSVWIHERL